MSGLRDRLNRLRAGSGASSAPPVSDNSERKTGEAEAEQKRTDSTQSGRQHELHEAFCRIGVQELENDSGPFLLRRIVYSLPYRHGKYELGRLLDCAHRLHPIAVRQNKQSERIDPRRMLFLDTETTGLGVGAGNVPFMIGFGYYANEAFVVEQTLIRHPGEERAMLTYLLDHMKDKTHLVSYNGRTFDWPVLANRFILNGWRSNGREPGHLDFLHPSRALWKNTLPSCRLGMVEGARLGIHRVEDVPGSMAPTLYFQYLSDGNPAHLHGVYSHNEKDILTLAALAVHFGLLLSDAAAMGTIAENEELFRTAGWLELHGEQLAAEQLFDQLAERTDESEADNSWRLALAARYKRAGRFDRALPQWRTFAESTELAVAPRIEAHLELAMYYEHRDKQLPIALTYAERALELALRRGRLTSDKAKREAERAALQHRIARLRDKASRERQAYRFD